MTTQREITVAAEIERRRLKGLGLVPVLPAPLPAEEEPGQTPGAVDPARLGEWQGAPRLNLVTDPYESNDYRSYPRCTDPTCPCLGNA